MKKLCIYHGKCADGFTAAWAVLQMLGHDNVEFYPGVYQEEPPDVTGRDVIIVDFSYKRLVLDQIGQKARTVLVLDHHKTAAEDLAGFPPPVIGTRLKAGFSPCAPPTKVRTYQPSPSSTAVAGIGTPAASKCRSLRSVNSRSPVSGEIDVTCQHMNFAATVNVFRHLDDETETHVVGYSAEVRIKCAECGKPFQFLGLPMGVDTHGARVSVDGLEARIAISPEGVQPSPINRMQFNISKHDS